MGSNPFRRLSATSFGSPSRKQRDVAVTLRLQIAAVAIPFLVLSIILYVLATLTNAWGSYDETSLDLQEPYRGAGEDVEGRAAPFVSSLGGEPGSINSSARSIQRELDKRFVHLGLPHSRISCPTIISGCKDKPTLLEQRYSHLFPSSIPSPFLSDTQGFYFAVNLFDSEAVARHLFQTILSTALLLGPSKVHISIFENGSRDKTPQAMAHFAQALTAAGIVHSLRSDPYQTSWSKVDRIQQLAVYRNEALATLFDFSPSSSSSALFYNPSINSSTSSHPVLPTDLIFINDVFVCPTDILELLHQRRVQDADATCGMDWTSSPRGAIWGWMAGWMGGSYRFYDNWVTRTLEGYPLRPRFDLFGELRDGLSELFLWDADPLPRQRFQAGLPTPVYSCFNGMAVYDAKPFLNTNLQGGEGVRFRAGRKEEGECGQSECTHLASDFWSLNLTRWVLVPRVALTYEAPAYLSDWIESRVRRAGPSTTEAFQPLGLEEKIDWVRMAGEGGGPKEIVCWPVYKGARLEVWPFFETSPAASTRRHQGRL